MKDRKTKTNKPTLKVVHRNDRAQIKRVFADSGQALLPMLELLEGAKASIDELMHDSAVTLVEQLSMISAQELAGVKQRGREVRVPAYDRLLNDEGIGQRIRDILIAGVSTRRYESVLPKAAGTVGPGQLHEAPAGRGLICAGE